MTAAAGVVEEVAGFAPAGFASAGFALAAEAALDAAEVVPAAHALAALAAAPPPPAAAGDNPQAQQTRSRLGSTY